MSQTITPELRQWIIAQAEAGCSHEAVLQSMRVAGWDEDVALSALESTLEAHLKARGLAPEAAEAGAGAAARQAAGFDPLAGSRPAVPEPDLDGSPLYLDGGDRRVSVLAVMQRPRVVVLGDLLSGEECDALIELARPRLSRSLTVAVETGGEELNDDRTSQGMFFQRGEHPVVARIEARLARLVNWPVEHGEGIQVLRYGPGAEYKPHYDYFDPKAPGTPTILRRGGQRVGTVVMYLSEPEGGGGTVFPDAKFEVMPRRGHGVFFSYPRPEPASRTLHGGSPVVSGEKWIATKWLREGPFK